MDGEKDVVESEWQILIPACNEQEAIASVVLPLAARGFPVLVVDDGSSDETARRAERAGAEVIRLERNRGKGAALHAGFRRAAQRPCRGVVTLDGDGQHDPREVDRFLQALNEDGVSAVVGRRTRTRRRMPRVRRWTNRAMSALLNRCLSSPVPDTQCGYRAYRREVLALLTSGETRFGAESEHLLQLDRAGHAVRSVPIRTLYRTEQSAIRPVRDAIRFLSVLRRAGRAPRPV